VFNNWKYTLKEPFSHLTRRPAVPVYSGERVNIRTLVSGLVEIIVGAGYSWDGNTGVPDLRGTYYASLLHDALYQHVDEIAAAWGWSVWRVLQWADSIYAERMRHDGAALATVIIYGGAVRVIGFPFNRTMKLLRRIFK
jgi:hypothetical protein